MKTALDSIRGISADGRALIQSRRGGCFMLLVRGDEGWVNVAECACYIDGCYLLDQFLAQ